MKTQTRIGMAIGLALALLAGLGPRAEAADASGSWNSTGNGTWSDTTKWTTTPPGNIPSGIGKSATITLNTTANAVITLDTPVTLGSILIGDGTSFTYDVVASGGNTMTMETGTPPATITKQNTASSDSFSPPLVLKSDLQIVNSTASGILGFTVNGAISESGGKRNVTCVNNTSGASVTLTSTASSYSGKTTVRYGGYNFASIGNLGVNSSLGAPANATDGTIDIGDGANAVTFQCTSATAMRTDRILKFVGTTGAVGLRGGAANQVTYTSPPQFTGIGAKTLGLNGVVVNGNMVNSDLSVVCGENGSGAKSSALLGLNTYKNGTTIYRSTLTINSLANVTTPGIPSSLGAPETVPNGTITVGDSGGGGTLKYVGTGHSSDRVIHMASTTFYGPILDASGYGRFTLTSPLTTAAGTASRTVTLTGTGEGELVGKIPDVAGWPTLLSKTGAGTWTLTKDNSSGFTGTTTINGAGGTLEVGHDKALNTGALVLTAGNLAAVGAARTLNNPISSISVGGFTGAQDLTLAGTIAAATADRTLYNTIASGKLTLDGAMNMADANPRTTTFEGPGDTIINGIIANGGAGAGALAMSGLGTLTLKGANTYGGATTMNSGTVLVDYAAGADMSATPPKLAGGTLKLKGAAGGTADTLGAVTVNAGGGGILVDPNGGTTTLTLGTLTATAVGGSALFGKASGAGSGTVTITTTTDKGATGIYPASTLFTDGTSTGYDWLSTASAISPYTLSGCASYAALATTAGTDTSQSRITGNTTMGGARTTNTLKIENPAAGQTLALGANLFTLFGGGLLVTGNNGFEITGDAGATRLRANNSTGLIIHQYNSGGLTISAVIGNYGGNATALTKAGSGKLTLSGANTYGNTTYANAGILELQNSSALGTGGVVLVKPGASVQLNGSGLTLARPINSLAGTGTDGSGALKNVSGANAWSGAIMIGTGGARIGNADTVNALTLSGLITTADRKDLTLGGAGNIVVNTTKITGAGQVIKDGAGTVELAVANDYTGATTVNAGTLRVTVAGAIAAGSKVTVSNTGVLTGNGTGTCSGTVRVNSGGTIKAPGTVGQKLTVGSLILDNLGVASFTVGGSDTEDYIDVTATGDLIDTLGLAILPGAKVYLSDPNQGGTFQLIQYAGEIKGSVANLTVVNATVGTVYTFSEAGGFVQLVVTPNAVPVIGQGDTMAVTMDEDGSPAGWPKVAGDLTATDSDGGTLTWSVSSPATHGLATVNGTGASPATFTYVPTTVDYNGPDSFVVKVTDPLGAEDTITVNVTIDPRNDAPVCTVVPVVSGNHLVGVQLSTDDGTWNDTKDTTYGGSFSPTFTYQWQRADDSGGGGQGDIPTATSSTYTLTGAEAGKYLRVRVTCTDSGVGGPGVQSTQAFSTPWTLVFGGNTAPTIGQAGPLTPTMDEDGIPTAWSAPTLTANDTDPGDNAILEWIVSSPASHGLATVSGTGTAPTTFTYVPTGDYNGSDSFEVTVSDGKPSGDATITVNVTIAARNDAPVCTVDPTHTFQAPDTAPLLINKTVMVNSDGTWNDTKDGGSFTPTFTYQWQRANDSGGGGLANISSANGSSYTVVSADERKWIRVAVTCTDSGVGTPGTANTTAYSPWQYVYVSYNLTAASDTAIGSNLEVIENPPDTVLVAGANPTYTYDFAMSSLNLNNYSIRYNSAQRNVVLANLNAVSDSGAGSIDTSRAGATGYIELYAVGPVQIGGSLITKTTSGNLGTGSIRVDGANVQIGGSVLTHTPGNDANHSGSVTINAPSGTIEIGSYVATYNNWTAGVWCQAGAVVLNAGNITIGGATTGLAIAAYGSQATKQGANVTLAATSGITLSTGGIDTHGFGGGDVLISNGAGGSAGDVYVGGSILSYSDGLNASHRSGAITVRGRDIHVTGTLNNDYLSDGYYLVPGALQPILVSGSGSVQIDGYVTASSGPVGYHLGTHNIDILGGSVTVNGASSGYSVLAKDNGGGTAGNITVTATAGDLTLAGGVDASHPTTESKRGAVALSAPNGDIRIGGLDANRFKSISLLPGASKAVHVSGALSNFTPVEGPPRKVTFPAGSAIGSDIYYNPAANAGVLSGTYAIYVNGSGDTGKKLMQALASQVVFTTQPSASTAVFEAFAQQPVVKIADEYGNVITSGADATRSVALTLTTGTGTLGGTATMDAVGGVADFAGMGLNINLVGADKVLTATATLTGPGEVTATTSPAFAITHAAASRVVVMTQPSPITVAGVAFAQQPVVTIEDPYGNVVDSGDDATRSVALTLTTGAGTLGGTATMNAVGGVANFAGKGLNINLVGADKVLTAAATLTAGLRTTTTSPALTITHAAASKVAFTTQPSASTLKGVAFAQQPVVTIEDPFGNVVDTGDDATRSVALSLTTGTGTLGGTKTMNAVGGVADFVGKGLNIDMAGANKELTATATLTVGQRTAPTDPFAVTMWPQTIIEFR